MSTSGPAIPCKESCFVDPAETVPELLDHNAVDNADMEDPALLETMLAKAERLAHELQDTCSSAAASSRAYEEYPASSNAATIDQQRLPEAIDLKDHGTECSSIGNGISVGQNKSTAFDATEHEVRDTHRFLASFGSTPLAIEGVNSDSAPSRALTDTCIDAFKIPVECDSRTTADKATEAPIPALVVTSPPLARAINEPTTKPDGTTVPVPLSCAERVDEPLLQAAVANGTKCVHTQTQPVATVDFGETTTQRSDEWVLQEENSNTVVEEQKMEMPSPDMPELMNASENFKPECTTAAFGRNASAHAILASTVKSTLSNTTILSVSTNSISIDGTSLLNVESSQRSYEHADEQKGESYGAQQQTLSTQVTPVSSNTTSPWVAASFATEVDDDYAPVADYIKWERVTSARQGDDDFVPLSDYSSPTNAQSARSPGPELLEMTYSRHRAAIRRRRKQRRRRLVAFVMMITLSIGVMLFRRLYSRTKVNKTIHMHELVVSKTLTPNILPSVPVVEDVTDLAKFNPHIEEIMSEAYGGANDVNGPIGSAIAVIDSSTRPDAHVSLHPLAILKATMLWSAPSRQERRILVEELIASMMQ